MIENNNKMSGNISEESSVIAQVIKCCNFAAIKHKDQRRKSADAAPYINHPIGVANILCNESNVQDLDVITAALLHDTVEDTDTTILEIEEVFGKVVAGLVAEVTDDKLLSKEARKLAQIAHAANSSRGAKLVKLADKIYNLRDLEKSSPVGWSKERIEEYFEWSYAVIEGLRGTDPVLEDILDKIFARRGLPKVKK